MPRGIKKIVETEENNEPTPTKKAVREIPTVKQLGSIASQIRGEHDAPDAFRVQLMNQGGRTAFHWAAVSSNDEAARDEFRAVLNEFWQSSSSNYEEIAKWTQLSVLDVQAFLDDEFREINGL